jgi:hypothetical protein
MIFLCSSSPTDLPASNGERGLRVISPFLAVISRIAPSSMPSFVLSSRGKVTCPFRLTRTLDNYITVKLNCSLTKEFYY